MGISVSLFSGKVKKIISVVLVVLIFVKFEFLILNQPSPLINYPKLRETWIHSQHNLGQGFEYFGMMSDEDLYAYAALEYIRGEDPSKINFEHPPLAKYLLGFSYVVFGNMLVIQFVAIAISLITVYCLSRKLGMSVQLSLLPPIAMAYDQLFWNFTSFSQINRIHLMFILLSLNFVLKKKQTLYSLVLLGFFVGGVFSTKVLFNGLLMLLFVILILKQSIREKPFISYFVVIIVSLATYFLSYVVFFFYHSISDFLQLHVDIIRFYRAYLPDYPWFEIWRILLLGEWRVWFADTDIISVPKFWIAWPLSTILSFSLLASKKTYKIPLKSSSILLFWSIYYLAYSSVHVAFPNYLLPIIPILYILSVFQSKNILKFIAKLSVSS